MKKTDKKRILVIEDEEHIAEGIKLNLSLQGYDVEIVGDDMLAGFEVDAEVVHDDGGVGGGLFGEEVVGDG